MIRTLSKALKKIASVCPLLFWDLAKILIVRFESHKVGHDEIHVVYDQLITQDFCRERREKMCENIICSKILELIHVNDTGL